MRLSKQHKQLIAYSLALHVEEMADDRNKERVEEILGHFQSIGIWGNEEGLEESFFPDDDED
jgi:RAB protein geranylgeranyltransferase component A